MISSFKRIIRRNSVLLVIFRILFAPFKYWDISLHPSVKSKANRNPAGNIIFSTILTGETSSLRFEITLAAKLESKGFHTAMLLCDGALDACQYFKHNSYPNDINWLARSGLKKKLLCISCQGSGLFARNRARRVIKISALIPPDVHSLEYFETMSVDKLRAYRYNNIPVGEEGFASYLRYFCVSEFEPGILSKKILAKYVRSALVTALALETLSKTNRTSGLICNHGVYVPNGITSHVAKRENIPLAVWNLSYRRGTFLMSLGDTYHREMLRDNWWHLSEFPGDWRRRITDYLKSRRTGSKDWVSFQNQSKELVRQTDLKSLEEDCKKYKHVTSLLTNVLWDAQIHFKENIFHTMLDWVFFTLDKFIQEPDRLLLLRVHPAEDRGVLPTRQRVVDEIKKRYKSLPKNIKIFESQSSITSYDCADRSDSIIIYGTKMGAEVAALGKPVIVVGDAWVRGKGFTFDPKSKSEYEQLLDCENLLLTEAQRDAALRYAYYFFYKRCIEVPYFKYNKSYPPFRLPITFSKKKLHADVGLENLANSIISHVRNPSDNRPSWVAR